VTNPRALLEVSLRNFTCITAGDIITIPYAGRSFDLEIREVQPNTAASIVETDCNVDFEEPVGYKESKYAEYERKREEEAKKAAEPVVRTLQRARVDGDDKDSGASFKAFTGTAKRIDGKSAASNVTTTISSTTTIQSEGKESCNALATTQSSSSNAVTNNETTTTTTTSITYESRIGDKYSKKKSAVSAFVGTARKLK
jgi:hypothetical protein